MNNKVRAQEIYNQHIALATADGRSFRKTVMDQMMQEMGISLASSATLYNNAKKAAPVEGLGRAPVPKGVRKMGTDPDKVVEDADVPDGDCFTVIELVNNPSGTIVGTCQSFLMQGDASEEFDSKISYWPFSDWVMISGLGPNPGDAFKLGNGESEIKRFMSTQSRVPVEAVTA